jgi:hypothetical protein
MEPVSLAVKLGIAVLGLFRAMGAWLLGRKNRKIGRMEVTLEGLQERLDNAEKFRKAARDQRIADRGGVSDDKDKWRRD